MGESINNGKNMEKHRESEREREKEREREREREIGSFHLGFVKRFIISLRSDLLNVYPSPPSLSL